MIDFNLRRIIFAIMTSVFIGLLLYISYCLSKKKSEYRIAIYHPVFINVITSILYTVILFVQNDFAAGILNSLFTAFRTLSVFSILLFVIDYTEKYKKYLKKVIVIFAVIVMLDSILLFVNNYFHQIYFFVSSDKVYQSISRQLEKFPLHIIHTGIYYLMYLLSLVLLLINAFTCPGVYKGKYLGVFFAYIGIFVITLICIFLNLPLDISVLLFIIFTGFISYYSVYGFPRSLLTKNLMTVNETISDGVLYFNEKGICTYANKIAKNIFKTADEFDSKKADEFYSKIKESNENFQISKIECFEIDGLKKYYKIEIPEENPKDKEFGSYLKLIDCTFSYESIEKDHYNSIHDELTGLLNRRGFLYAVDEYIEKNGCEGKLIVTSNIKDFKFINDQFGDQTGDDVLLKQANLIKEYAHEGTIFGRTGDDKFSIFGDKKYLNEINLKKYISIFQQTAENIVYKMNIAGGIYDPEGRTETAFSMYDKTLMALEKQEENPSNLLFSYDSTLMEKLLDEKNICEDFKVAIEKEQIEMYFQPIVNKNMEVKGVEALCRWNHPVRGVMESDFFVKILEKGDLIYQLDEYMWTQAVRKLQEWSEKGCLENYISVNISIKDLYYTDIYKTLIRLVEDFDVNPSSLHIEITESFFMSDLAKVLMLSNKLQKAGFVVTIDKFGNGYSSLNVLKDVEAQIIKIDMSFLQNSENEERDLIILNSIIDMTKSLGIGVICEGVENHTQFEQLKKMGCDSFQGDFLIKPMTVKEYEKNYLKITDDFGF